jgi:DnaK suppressor protein
MKTQQATGTRAMDGFEIERFRLILTIRLDEAMTFLDRVQDEAWSGDSDCPKDTGDLGAATLSRETLFQQASERRLAVRMIETALARIRQGTFGVCTACGEGITPRRLYALPWARYCFRCQEDLEQQTDKSSNEGSAGWSRSTWRDDADSPLAGS